MQGQLHIIALPIGNLQDITLRALELLKQVDKIACEDTRVTGRLLTHFGIKTPMMVYHDFSKESDRRKILRMLEEGKQIALVSDAGTPLISDPGYKLVHDAYAHDITVTSIPGPSAVITALTLSGLPTDRFYFEGFLPNKKGQKRKRLEAVAALDATLVYYESGRRIAALLAEMIEVFGDRKVATLRELTKKFEEVNRGTLSELLVLYKNGDAVTKGEFVVIVEPAGEQVIDKTILITELKKSMQTMRLKEAVDILTEKTGISRKIVYNYALQLREQINGKDTT